MGMISRVRARLQSLHSLTTRIDPKIQDERTAQTGKLDKRLFINLIINRTLCRIRTSLIRCNLD